MHLSVEEEKTETVLPRIYRAALRLFVQKGIEGTTTKDIARAARVSEGALYRHFKSKDYLAYHLFSSHLHQFTQELAGRVRAVQGAKARLRIFIRECFEAFETERELFTFLILSEHRELSRFPLDRQHPGHLAQALVKEGQEAGEFRRQDPYIGAGLLIGGLIRLCLLRIHGNLRHDLRRETDGLTEQFWKALRT